MAWTTPRTWVTDELVTAALMNAHIRDNFDSVMHLVARKTADETQSATTALQNDDALSFVVAANDVWLTRWSLVYTTPNVTTGLKLAWSFPAAAILSASFLWFGPASTVLAFGITGTSNPTTSLDLGALAIGSDINVLSFDLLYVGSSTAGTVQLQWAQRSSDASGTTVKANSTVLGVQLA